MKTVTNYAEKKAKQFLNLLQSYTKGIRMTAILILLLMGVSNAWAGVSGGEIYFDALTSGWGSVSSVEYVISHDSYSQWYKMANISNTQLYYISSASWGDAKYIAFTANFGWASAEGKKYEDRISWAPATGKYTKKNSYGVNSGSTYLFYASSSTNNATITTSSPAGYLGNGKTYTALNYTQTVQQHLSTDGGSNYSASTAALATVKVSSYKLKSKNATESSSGTIASGSSSTTCSAARTATVTYTVSGVKTGYTFVGWYDGTTQKSTSTTYTYNATAAKTITARFKENTYTVTVKNDGHGTTTPSDAQSNVGQVTGLSITATPAANYEFVNWTITSGSGSFGSATSASTTFKPTSAATIQANFRSTATNSLTVVAGANIESVAGSEDPVTLGKTYDIKATPKTGYLFSTWTADPAANATFGSATTANATVTVKNGSVTVTASATENTHNVIVSYKCGDITIQDNTTSNVGEANAQSITAPDIDGYTFTEWTLGNGITNKSANTTTNPISITTKASGEYTLTANYEEQQHVYFVNTARWETINIHAWKDGGNGTTWPGTQLTTPVETINGFDVYKYILPEGKDYNKVIFNNISNNNGVQTADLNWENGKYYVYSANKWVDKNEVENILPKPVIYFKNNLGWKEVYVYFHQGEYWGDADNQGSGSSGLTEANGRVCKMCKHR